MDTNHIQASRVGKDSHVPYHKMSSDMFRLTVLILLVWGLVLTGCGAKSESKREKGLALDLAEINENLVKQGDRSGVLEAEQSAREKREDRPDVKSLSFFKDGKNSDLADIPGSKEERRGTDAGKRVDQEEGILLNFNNADIYEVIKVIAEALDLNYIIDPQVKGVVNIHSGKKIPYSELFAVFKKILHINGLDISKEEDYYYIHMAKKASPDQVYGPDNVDELKDSSRQVIQVIPLFYIPAAEAMDLLNPYLSAQGGVYSLGSQNTLIISDYESKVADALRILAKLDTASLASMEVQLVRIDEAPVSKLKEELDEILQALKVNAEPLQGVAVIPLARINSLLLVGISEENVTMARRWINELDVMPASDQDSIYVYNVRNSVASKLADLVKQLISEEEPVSDKENHQDDRNKAHPGRKPPLSSLGFKGSPVIFADDDRNMVLIRGLAPDYKRVVRILEKLDTLPRQVLVEVILAELTLKNELSFGIEWAFHNQNISKGGQDYRQDFISNLADLVYSDAEGVPGFTYALSKGRNVYGLLQTLASQNDVSVLSSPQLLVLNNETATINVGKEVPIVTTETQNEAADDVSTVDKTVQYKDTGVILEVTPQINYNGIILLDIKQNVSDALENTSSGIDSPEISQRELNTKLAVKDGQTILMGGLIDQGDSEIASGIPFLMDLPGIGYLFKYKKEVQEKTELLVMITPYVIETEEVLDQYIGEFKKKMKVLRGRFMSDDNFHRAGE